MERLLDCMGKVRQYLNMSKVYLHFLQIYKTDNGNTFSQEKSELQKKLQELEQRLRSAELKDTTDGTSVKRYTEIAHLNKHHVTNPFFFLSFKLYDTALVKDLSPIESSGKICSVILKDTKT